MLYLGIRKQEMVAITVPAEPESFVSEVDMAIEVNGITQLGRFEGFYDAGTNVNGGLMDFEDIAELDNSVLMWSCTSAISWSKCVFSKPINGAVNLISVMGLPFRAEVDFTLIDATGRLFCEVHQAGELNRVGPGRLKGHTQIEGFNRGDTDVKWSPGYSIWLRQVRPGQIQGVYGQTIFRESGEPFYVLSRRNYFYDNDNVLPFDIVWNYRLLSLDVALERGRRLIEYRASAHYVPAEADHGSIEEANRAYAVMLKQERAAALV